MQDTQSTSAEQIHTQELPSGLPLLLWPEPNARLTHVALVINAGTRHEQAHEQGAAHLLEHLLFKGTRRRKAWHILNRIDSLGGELNAYTTREKTVFHATAPAEHTDKAVDLLLDIGFGSTLPPGELDKERQVVAEEIDMYRDTPDEAILEDFDLQLFGHHPLGWPILGSRDSLAQLDRNTLQAFYRRWYQPQNAALAVSGPLTPKRLRNQAQRSMQEPDKESQLAYPTNGAAEPALPDRRPQPAPQLRTERRTLHTEHNQSHLVLGGLAYAYRQGRYLAFQILNHHLGGPTMNNQLNLAIREKRGLTYNLYSSYTSYLDTGYWLVYAGMERQSLPRVQRYIRQELDRVRQQPLGPGVVKRLKRQFAGHLLLGQELRLSRLLAQAKHWLDFGSFYSLDELLAEVAAVGAEDLQQAAQECFDPEQESQLIYLPEGPGRSQASSQSA